MVVSGGRSETSKRCAARWSHIPRPLLRGQSPATVAGLHRNPPARTTSAHDIIKLQYTKHEVHTASCNAAVVDCKASYGLSDRRGWRDGAVDCCLPSIGYDYWRKYWANTNTTQYRQVLANTQYSNTGIVRTLGLTATVIQYLTTCKSSVLWLPLAEMQQCPTVGVTQKGREHAGNMFVRGVWPWRQCSNLIT